MTSSAEPWARLICTTDHSVDPIVITKDTFVIGRAEGCDHVLAKNNHVSGKHCYIQRLSGGQVILHDTSTNGTLLNRNNRLKQSGDLLNHGDEFHVVHKRDSENLNIGYIFQDLKALEEETTDATVEYSSECDKTLSDEIEFAETEEKSPKKERKRSASPPADDGPSKKVKKSDGDVHTSQPAGPSETGKKASADTLSSCGTEVCGGAKNTEDDQMKEKKSCEKNEDDEDAIAEALVCIICQEILHDCISLQPCMHSFCSGCYSEWMAQSNECPSCRMKVQRINKNHIVNNLVEAYLKLNPGKQRSEEEIKELDGKNTITRDMLYPKEEHGDEDRSSEDDEDDASDRESPFPPRPLLVPGPALGTMFGRNITVCRCCPNYQGPVNAPGPTRPPTTGGAEGSSSDNDRLTGSITGNADAGDNQADSQEPSTSGATGTGTGVAPGTGVTGRPSLKDEKVMPIQPVFVCGPQQTHAICLCCMQPMPDRRQDRCNDPSIPHQQCDICYRFYCHAYWGCRKGDCLGCIGKFKDMNFGKKCLTLLVNDNTYESEILKNYLENNNISVRDMLQQCLAKMEEGSYHTIDFGYNHRNASTCVCYSCGLKNFKELAYQYRRDIPNDELPAEVTSRQDCYWGKNCRTQKNKPHHARRFNHICDQQRTT